MKDKNLDFESPKEAGRSLLIKMDLLKRYFGITARSVYLRAGVDECFGNNVLHARKMGKPTLLKIHNAVFYFAHRKYKSKTFFLTGQVKSVQEIMKGFEWKNFSDFLNTLIGQKGQGTLADEIKVDPAILSKFRSGQGGINLAAIDKIFEVGNASIISKKELNRIQDTIETITDLWKQERNRNGGGK